MALDQMFLKDFGKKLGWFCQDAAVAFNTYYTNKVLHMYIAVINP